MSLADRLRKAPAPDARRVRQSHPKGFEPGVKFEAGQLAEVNVQLTEIPEDEQAWRDEITRVTTLTVPDGKRVVLSQVRYWGDPKEPQVYCRFLIEDRPVSDSPVDVLSILHQLRDRKAESAAFTGDSTFVLALNDWQAGKLEGGGTEALAERLDAAYTKAAQRIAELRAIDRDLGHLVILGGGDMVEGCGVYQHQAYEIDADRRSQIRNTVTLILEGLDRLAPMFQRVTVLAVGGNHGEHRIDGRRVNRSDNDDLAVFEHAALAASRDERLGHVEFVIADDEPAKTIEVNGWILGITHGHVFGKGAGSPEQKAWKWFQGQAAGRQPAGDCDVLVSAHYHHLTLRDWGACQWIQAPAMDGGSPHFTDWSGQAAKPGMLSFVMTPQHRCIDLQVL